jgi:hypothetical protein
MSDLVARSAEDGGRSSGDFFSFAVYLLTEAWWFLRLVGLAAVALLDYFSDFVSAALAMHGYSVDRSVGRIAVLIICALLSISFRKWFVVGVVAASVADVVHIAILPPPP